MAIERTQGYPVLIIGAGRGGHALLEMFLEDSLVKVIGVADSNPAAPGIQLAKKHGIPTYFDAVEALNACKAYPDCIVYNLSHDDSVAREADKVLGDRRVASGLEVKLFWQMVTNLKQVKVELERSQNQLQSVIRNVMDGIIMINESREICGFNPAAEQIFGYSQQEVLGKNVKMLMPEPVRKEHDVYIHRYLETGQARMLGRRGRELIAVRKDGVQFPMEMSLSEMVLGESRYFIGVVRDITERKQAEEKIAHLAHHDYLTDLPNRAQFMNRLEHSVLLAERNRQMVAVLFLDLDGFKQVNDSLGHDSGDLLLKEVSNRLRAITRASDTVARVGGDEFTFVLNHIESEENATHVARKIIGTLAEPFDLGGHACHVSGSVGISIFPTDAKNYEELIKQADEAMYLAKQSGKNTSKSYRDRIQERGQSAG